MNSSTRTTFRKLIRYGLLLFFVLFIFRFIHGYLYVPVNYNSSESYGLLNAFSSGNRNYASTKYKAKSVSSSMPATVDQKYEKIAEIGTKSSAFEDDEKNTRQKIKDFDALIQYEQKSGNKGSQVLNLMIGVPPDNFDKLYNQLIKIGKVGSKKITKTDKTNEYRTLKAKKLSLEKIRNSLIELKTKGGQIDEYVKLENRILEIEKELQSLGVSLGDFDSENEFCTVKFSMTEGEIQKISITQRIKVALQWTVKWYLAMVTAMFFLTAGSYLIIKILEKFDFIKE